MGSAGRAARAPADPFEDTPAARFPVGEAGITMPAAVPVDGFTVAEIDALLKQVRAVLVATRLDRRMTVDHDASVVLGLLATVERDRIRPLIEQGELSGGVTRVAKTAKLGKHEPRVSGRVTIVGGLSDRIRHSYYDPNRSLDVVGNC